MRRTILALSVAAALVPVGTSSTAVADDGDGDKEEQQIEARLQAAPDLKNNDIDVDVEDGIAVLEGTVDSERERREAQRLAHVDGVLGVNNRLHVRGPAR